MRLFVSCAKGFEPLLQNELHRICSPRTKFKPAFRGVFLELNDEDELLKTICQVNYTSRIAIRALLPIQTFHLGNTADVYSNAMKIQWSHYVPRGKTISVNSLVNHREFNNSVYASQLVKDAIVDRIRSERGDRLVVFISHPRPVVDLENPDVRIHFHGTQKKVPLYSTYD